jgi:hypothetical protein
MNSTDTEFAEEPDSEEALDFDENQYPQLPDNVLELRLHRWKAILRLFMAAARCTCDLCPHSWRCLIQNRILPA